MDAARKTPCDPKTDNSDDGSQQAPGFKQL